MPDVTFQQFSTVQSDKLPYPATVASAATIVPTTKLTYVTGTVSIANITPPVSGYHELSFIFLTGSMPVLATTGNIQFAFQPIINRVFTLYYDPSTAKYWA